MFSPTEYTDKPPDSAIRTTKTYAHNPSNNDKNNPNIHTLLIRREPSIDLGNNQSADEMGKDQR